MGQDEAGLEEEGEIGSQVWWKWQEKRARGYPSIELFPIFFKLISTSLFIIQKLGMVVILEVFKTVEVFYGTYLLFS